MPKKSDRAENTRIATSALDRSPYIPSNTQLHRISALFLAARERAWSARTYYNHKYRLRRLYEVLGPVEISEIDRPHVAAMVAARRRAGVNEHTIVSDYQMLVTLLEWCAKQGIIPFPITRTMRPREFGLPVQPWRWHWNRGTPLLTLVRHHQETLK